MDAVQRQQDQLKQLVSTMSPFEKIQKDHDIKALKKKYNNLKQDEEQMVERLDPLHEPSAILSQVIEDKKKELIAMLEEMKVKIEELVSGQLVEEVKEQNAQVQLAITECTKRYGELCNIV